jgi:hypothetical protein
VWTYYIRSGEMRRADGSLLSICHSGFGDAMNDPARCPEKNVGPIPPGYYVIGGAFHHPTCGPVSMRLEALPGTYTHGRGGFLIHGRNKTPTLLDDSHGCIIDERGGRIEVAGSLDRLLEVVAERPESMVIEPVAVAVEPVERSQT